MLLFEKHEPRESYQHLTMFSVLDKTKCEENDQKQTYCTTSCES